MAKKFLNKVDVTSNATDALALTGAGAGITFGGDTTLYRSSGSLLRTAGYLYASQWIGGGGDTAILGYDPVIAAAGRSLTFLNTAGTVYTSLRLNTSDQWVCSQKLLAAGLDAQSNLITNVTDPSGAQDAATKNYVDTHAGGSTAFASQWKFMTD